MLLVIAILTCAFLGYLQASAAWAAGACALLYSLGVLAFILIPETEVVSQNAPPAWQWLLASLSAIFGGGLGTFFAARWLSARR
jgi:hypothetical protein